MARFPNADAIYRVADLYRERCLTNGQSLLWPDHAAWTVENLNAFHDAFVGHPDEGSRNFFEKWKDQLADQSDDVVRIAADLLAVYLLFPAKVSIGPAAKFRAVEQVISWRPDTLKLADEERSFLEAAFASGIGSVGTSYNTRRPWEIQFLLEFSRDAIARGVNPNDAEACKRLAESVNERMGMRMQSRHSLLHLLFPDQFERMSTATHKKQIVEAFPTEAGTATDLDDQLFAIRTALSNRLHRPDFDFYQEDIRALWDSASSELTRDPSSDSIDKTVWLFQANPDIWSLADALQESEVGDEESWSVSRYRNEMKAGDPVVLWQSGANAGIYALGELIGEPFERETADF